MEATPLLSNKEKQQISNDQEGEGVSSCCTSIVSRVVGSWKTSKTLSNIKTASPKDMWILLCNLKDWPKWDFDLESAELDDPSTIRSGSEGTLRMKKRGDFRFCLVDLDSSGFFAYTVQLTGASTYWSWSWKEVDGTDERGSPTTFIEVEMSVSVDGWAAYLYKYWIEEECSVAFEKSLAAIKVILESRTSAAK